MFFYNNFTENEVKQTYDSIFSVFECAKQEICLNSIMTFYRII